MFIFLNSTFGHAVVAQIGSPKSSLQRKFYNADQMINYTAKLSPEDKLELLNSSTVVCTRNGEELVYESQKAYKFYCFVNNVQGVELQLDLDALNAGKNGFQVLGYEASNETVVKFEDYANLKFTVYPQSRVVFTVLLSSDNYLKLNANSNQGKIVFVEDPNEFLTFVKTMYAIDSIFFLKSTYEKTFGTSADIVYSVVNIETSDSSVQEILSSLKSFEVFNLLGGKAIEKIVGSTHYFLSYDSESEKIVVKSGDQVVGTADPTLGFVPAAELIPPTTSTTLPAAESASIGGIISFSGFGKWWRSIFGGEKLPFEQTPSESEKLELKSLLERFLKQELPQNQENLSTPWGYFSKLLRMCLEKIVSH